MMIALAIESSNSRGMGHLFRSLLFVKYMREHGIDFVYLINNDKRSQDILIQKGIQYEIVDYDDCDSNWEKMLIHSHNIDIWINDKFETSIEMALNIKREAVYLVLIDDIGLGEKKADINFVGLIYFSKQIFYSTNTKVGMEYVILNDEINRYKRLRTNLGKIIVSFGGSDPHNNTVKIVRELLKYRYDFDVAVGPNYRHEKELHELNDGRYHVFKSVFSLIELFANYDLVITGGGVTCCEANAAGLPCIIVANAPHEINTGKHLQEYGGCIYAGDYESWNSKIVSRLPEINLKQMSERGMQVFTTDAIDRIFAQIMKHANR